MVFFQVLPEGIDPSQLVPLNPTAAAILAAAQPALTAIPQPVASPTAVPQPVAVPISMAGMMLQQTAGAQPLSLPQAGAPVMVASQGVSLAAALAGQPQAIMASGATTLPAGTSLIPGLSPFGRPVLVRQATPGLPASFSIAGLRAIPTAGGLAGQPQLVAAHPGLPGAVPGLAGLAGMPAGMMGGVAGLPGLAGTPAGIPSGMVLGPHVLLPSRLPRPM